MPVRWMRSNRHAQCICEIFKTRVRYHTWVLRCAAALFINMVSMAVCIVACDWRILECTDVHRLCEHLRIPFTLSHWYGLCSRETILIYILVGNPVLVLGTEWEAIGDGLSNGSRTMNRALHPLHWQVS